MNRQHWLCNALIGQGLSAPTIDINATMDDAWSLASTVTSAGGQDLAVVVSRHFRLELADFGSVEESALKLLPESLVRQHHVVPIRSDYRSVVVATANPNDFEAEQEISFVAGRKVQFVVAAPAAIQIAIDERYAPEKVLEALVAGVRDDAGIEVQAVDGDGTPQLDQPAVDAGPVIKLTNLILRDAIDAGASDIHIEPQRTGGVVRFRVDGVLRKHMPLPMAALTRVVSRIKVLSNLDIADRLRPQDGRARVVHEGRTYDLRISTVPTREAEKVVIRILDTEATVRMSDVGLPDRELKRLRKVLKARDGIVVVTGPTGSGKTTTLYAAITELATEEVNVMTVEDPVEYELAGVTQIQVESKRGVTFASALRAILRQDPDVIFVGEIRDAETAEVAVHASTTGHLVLATVHTNDAAGAVQRLVDLGLDRSAIAGSLRAVVAQRLLRRTCKQCGAASPSTPPPGCEQCGQTGYRGRIPVVELLEMTKSIERAIAAGESAVELERLAIESGMRPMSETGRALVQAGVTTEDELERVLGEVAASPSDGDDPSEEPESATRVLVVDDDAVVRTMAKTLLEKSGYEVLEAEHGQAALDQLDTESNVDLVVLDLEMPEMNGLEVLTRVRGNLRTKSMPVIVLTGSEDEAAELQLMDAGADDYIRKPIDPPRFAVRVKAVMRRAGG